MRLRHVLLAAVALAVASPAFAIPSLQLGPGTGNWTYDTNTQTWVTDTNPFSVNLYANADTPGAKGSFAWDAAGAGTRWAYFVVSAIPMTNMDYFDVTVMNDGANVGMFTSGYGAPPIQDPNSLAPHGIFDTYFEIYAFQFDGPITTIYDTQPPLGGSGGDGYAEEMTVTINSMQWPVTGIHMDLFVVEGDGTFDPNATAENRSLVNAFAPFSHDAEQGDGVVPEPGTLILFSLGLLGTGVVAWRRRKTM